MEIEKSDEKTKEDEQQKQEFKNIVLNFAYNNYDFFLNPYRKVMLNILYYLEKRKKDPKNEQTLIFLGLVTAYSKECIFKEEQFF